MDNLLDKMCLSLVQCRQERTAKLISLHVTAFQSDSIIQDGVYNKQASNLNRMVQIQIWHKA